MHRALLAAASLAAFAVTSPASAQSLAASGFNSMAGGQAFRTDLSRVHDQFGRTRLDNRHRHHRHIRDGIVPGGFGYSGYNDYGDYDANRSFDPDKWNDWWHDRPDRAFPRWMSRNQDCARPWYSGDVLTC